MRLAGLPAACCCAESASAGGKPVGGLSCHHGRCCWASPLPSHQPTLPLSAVPAYQRVKLQRAEGAPIKTVPGLFATVLYVDNLLTVSLGWVQLLLDVMCGTQVHGTSGGLSS